MAKTQDYFDYFVNQIDIAPANSQEELDASQLIASMFDAHGLEPTIQEFETSENNQMFYGIIMAILFLGFFIAGIGGAGLTALGILLVLGAAALLIMRYLGNDVLASYGPVAKSQNVIGFHEATGDLAAKGNRPIIILAHYDTPREDLYSIPALAPYQGILKQACVVCVPVVAVIAVFQAFGFIPSVGRRVLWLIGLIASLPVLLWGVTLIAKKFMGCTPGVNNNKAALAAMMGILNNIRPVENDGVPETRRPRRTRETIAAAMARAAGDATRHGKEVLESLEILPPTTEINYVAQTQAVEPEGNFVEEATASEFVEGAEEQATGELEVLVNEEEPEGDATRFEVIEEEEEAAPEESDTAEEAVAEEEPTEDEEDFEDAEAELEEEITEETDTAQQELELFAESDSPEATGIREATASEAEADTLDPNATIAVPALVIEGEGDEPKRYINRAPLFDLPDPAQDELDPLDTTAEREASLLKQEEDGTSVIPSQIPASQTVRIDTTTTSPNQDEIGHITPEDLDFSQTRKRRGLFGRRRKADEPSMSDWLGVDEDYDAKTDGRKIGSWDNFNDEDPEDSHEGGSWKGGATENGRFRVFNSNDSENTDAVENQDVYEVQDSEAAPNAEDPAILDEDFELEFIGGEEEAQEPSTKAPELIESEVETEFVAEDATEDVTEEEDVIEFAPDANELRDAILSMGDDLLISHDIWFIAAGASDLNHAGIKAFLADYRRACRGAFLINLDCIGSGELSVLTEEGLEKRRRADRRLVRLLSDTAADIHVDLAHATMPWGDTDATPAMRTSMRSATIVGLDDAGLPSRAHSLEDEPEYVDDQQVEDVCTLVTELIRRS